MTELKRCPECGGVATVIHMYDTYDRADFGWDAGCGRYRAGDGLHTKEMKVSGLPSWMQDEVCVNADCPACADYCPVANYPGVCRFEGRGDFDAQES